MSKPKLIEQIENAGGIFIAIKDTTTYQEIKNAWDSGKDIIVVFNSDIYMLTEIPTGSNTLKFYYRDFRNRGYSTTNTKYLTLTSDNVWSSSAVIEQPTQMAEPITGNGETPISASVRYLRPILISTAEPTASDGNIGDIWIQYEGE